MYVGIRFISRAKGDLVKTGAIKLNQIPTEIVNI